MPDPETSPVAEVPAVDRLEVWDLAELPRGGRFVRASPGTGIHFFVDLPSAIVVQVPPSPCNSHFQAWEVGEVSLMT